MPTIALSLGLIYIAWLVMRDCRRRPTVSSAVWVPTILLLILGSRPASLWITGGRVWTTEMGNQSTGNLIDQMFYFVVLSGSFLLASLRGLKWNKLFTANIVLMLFYMYFAFSISWSGDPSGSLKRLFKDFGLLFAIGVILSEKDPLMAMRAVYVRCAAVLFPLSVVFIKYFPIYSRDYARNGGIAVTGVTTQKNSLGEIVLVFSLFLAWDYLETYPPGFRLRLNRGSWDHFILILMGVWLLRLSASKTAEVGTVVGIFLVARGSIFASKAVNRSILAGALSLPFVLFFSQQFHSVLAPITAALGRDTTFTGRADIWAHITSTTVNPVIGAGYWNFWGGPGGALIMQAMTTPIPNAHNGYLDIYLDGGMIGLTILFLLLLLSGLRITKKFKVKRTDLYVGVRFAVLIVAIIYSLSESAFARLGPLWFTTLLMIVEFPMKTGAGSVKGTVKQVRKSILDQTSPVLLNR